MNDYELETAEYLKFGLKIFQVFRFDDDDEIHCRQYWNYCENPNNGVWADMGSGIGTVGYYLNKFAPDLTVYSITILITNISIKLIFLKNKIIRD